MYTSDTDVCVLCKKLSLLWYNTNEYNTNVFISNQGPIKGKIITMIKYMGTMCNVYTIQCNNKITEYNNDIGWYLYNIGYTTSVW